MSNRPFWRRKSTWLPALLTIYFLVMAFRFGTQLIILGKTWTFVGIAAGEILVLVLLVIFLRKREKKD